MSDLLPTELDGGPRALRTAGVTKRFRAGGLPLPRMARIVRALDGLDLEVPEGAVYVLVGPNGAGKTTFLRILLDLLRPDAGDVEVLGRDPAREGGAVRARIGYVPEGQELGHGWLRVRDLLDHHAAYHPAWDAGYAAELADRLEVMEDRKFGELSKGHARRVQLVMALAHRPPLLLLDEPTDGLDPVVRDRVLELLADHLAAHPTTVLISTHLVHEAERLADHLAVMKEGRLVLQAPRSTVTDRLRRYRIRAPDGWRPPSLDGRLLRRRGEGRERAWTAWGEPGRTRAELEGAGAEVREVGRLSLEEAVLALLDDGEEGRG